MAPATGPGRKPCQAAFIHAFHDISEDFKICCRFRKEQKSSQPLASPCTSWCSESQTSNNITRRSVRLLDSAPRVFFCCHLWNGSSYVAGFLFMYWFIFTSLPCKYPSIQNRKKSSLCPRLTPDANQFLSQTNSAATAALDLWARPHLQHLETSVVFWFRFLFVGEVARCVTTFSDGTDIRFPTVQLTLPSTVSEGEKERWEKDLAGGKEEMKCAAAKKRLNAIWLISLKKYMGNNCSCSMRER